MNIKSIQLTRGKVTIVDEKDFNILSQFKWCFDTSTGYPVSRINGKNIRMHRFLLRPKKGLSVDHINGDKMDNRRINLRVCTHSQNLMNLIVKRKNNTSGFKGVSWHRDYKKWKVVVSEKTIGYFNNKIEAAKKYNEIASIYFGEFARLNTI